MKLVICEKPSVGAAVAAALGVTGKKDGYIENSPAWDLGTIWAPFTEKAPLIQAIKETPRTRKNIEFMRVSGVF